MINDGGPAFPHVNPNYDGNWDKEPQRAGMSIRDWFAGQAMVAIISKMPLFGFRNEGVEGCIPMTVDDACHLNKSVSRGAYEYADAMLKEREK